VTKFIYAVHDYKARVFGNPYTAVNDDVALRDYSRACTDPNSDLSHFPADYSLFAIAAYDDATGAISPFTPPVNLGSYHKSEVP